MEDKQRPFIVTFVGAKTVVLRVQKRVVPGANASLGAKTRAAHQPRNFWENFLCARHSSRREDSIGINTSALNWVVEARGGGGGEKRSRLFIESPITLGLYSPSRHHHRRLRPPAYGSPNKTKTKTKQKKSSPGLSNRPCGLGPTAHLSILNTEAERIPVIYKTKPKPKRRDDPARKTSQTPSRKPGPNPVLYSRKTSHRTSPKASHTFQHLLSKRRSFETTARSSPYPPRGSDMARQSGPVAAAAHPRCVRQPGKQGKTGPWLYVVAGIERSKAVGAHSGVLSGSRGCCTGAGG
jgi:hypothetical protein